MSGLFDRPLGDAIVLIFVILLCALAMTALVGVITLSLFRPEIDTAAMVTGLGNFAGVILGYVIGRTHRNRHQQEET